MTRLDHLLPSYDFSERHQRQIAASPAAVWKALSEITLRDLTLTRPLVAIRGLGSGRGRLDRPVFTHGPVTMVLVNEPWYAVGALVAKPWQPSPVRQPIESLEDFLSFDQTGWATCLVDFRLQPSEGGTLLTTETRVACTGSRARRRFRLYWLLIRPFSGLIRRDMLAGAARRAVAAEHTRSRLRAVP